jgi:hypothetical protein
MAGQTGEVYTSTVIFSISRENPKIFALNILLPALVLQVGRNITACTGIAGWS